MPKGKSFDNKISSKLATAQISAAQHKHKSISQSHHLYCHPSSFADTLLLFYFFILNVLLCQFVVVLIVVLLAGISSFAPVVLSGFVCICCPLASGFIFLVHPLSFHLPFSLLFRRLLKEKPSVEIEGFLIKNH